MADTEIVADPPRNATGFDADTSSARNASVAPGNNGNSSSPAHRPFTTDGACHAKLALKNAGLSAMAE